MFGYLHSLDNVDAFVCVQTWLWSGLVFVWIHHNQRVTFSDVGILRDYSYIMTHQGLAVSGGPALRCLFLTMTTLAKVVTV